MKQSSQDLQMVLSFIPEKDRESFERRAKTLLKYYRGDGSLRDQLRDELELERKWYESVEEGKPLYELYALPDFAIEAWACFYSYSQKYIKMLQKNTVVMDFIENEIDSVLDVGCGIGLTCRMFRREFELLTRVTGFNVPGSLQYEIAEQVSDEVGFMMTDTLEGMKGHSDLIFASEYFEHFFDPIGHLNELLDLEPKMFVIANSFTSVSVGHFPAYKCGDEIIENTLMQRRFNKRMREAGFGPLVGPDGEVRFWNNRPQVWVKL